MQGELSVINLTKIKMSELALPTGRQAFALIKDDILGKEYSLSIAYVGEKKSREINKKYRNKDKPTNILSFALSKTEGEIILCPSVIKREAKNFNKSFPKFLGFLVIHGMLHLKGYDHGKKMEVLEIKYEKKYLSRTKF